MKIKNLWEIDYEKCIAMHQRQGIGFEDLNQTERRDSNKKTVKQV